MKDGKGLKISIIAIAIGIVIIVAALIFVAVLNSKPRESSGISNTPVVGTNESNETENVIEDNSTDVEKTEAKITYVETSDGNKIPVPEGFTYVEGAMTKGAVIKDADGNEFVWVPLLNNLYTRRTFIDPNSVSTNETGQTDENTTNQINFSENENMDYSTSVNKYKGFYIARYEASKNESDEKKAKSIKGVTPWTEITYEQMSEIAKKTYESNPYITSDLPSSYSWDLMCKWLQDSGYDIFDSTQYGNYTNNRLGTHSLAITGRNTKWAMNNIFDIAGNAWEISTETWKYNGKKNHACRGGGYTTDGKKYPVSCKQPEYDGVYTYIGFRLVIYLN